ncbi:MAG: ArsR family transcriptional regulator [Spirochaetes bacterium]|nr:MAG: ArsR family transcriptional regulator [Spirochaetota bacterium]
MKKKLKIFKALSDETRLKIVELLISEGEKCVCEIVPYTGRSQSTISTQLAKLEFLDIVKSTRTGKRVAYKVVNKKVEEILKLF